MKNTQRPSTYYNANYQYAFIAITAKENDNGGSKMHGSRRVIVFCFLTTILPTVFIMLPLYLRNIRYADVMYKISESDVIQIHKGQSSIFCEKHSISMNSSFNAFQMKGTPELSNKRKNVRLKKSMSLPDDTLEYWGFYLFKGATVELKACSRYDGSKILVVKGEKILNTCGILESNKIKKDSHFADNQGNVVVILENPTDKKNNDSKFNFHNKQNSSEEINIGLEDVSIENGINKNDSDGDHVRLKRYVKRLPIHNPNTVLDTGVNHGGNAYNMSLASDDNAISSFENSLYECYHGNILINEDFPSSTLCNSTNYLEKTKILKVVHDVALDGYYYYIFYSDNDIITNDIHAIFDIYKPTFQYSNTAQNKMCLNSTECDFAVSFFSDELVIVEVPTNDGLRNDDETYLLKSVCHPRISVYIIFPILVILFILLFAFL